MRPTLELLEGRLALATYVVNTTADLSIAAGVNFSTGVINGSGGQVSLRSARIRTSSAGRKTHSVRCSGGIFRRNA